MERPMNRRSVVETGWHEQAACAGEDVRLFFAPEGEGASERRLREAFALDVCSRCPARLLCLEDAVTRNDHHGVRGGLTPDGLTSERRRRQRKAAEVRRVERDGRPAPPSKAPRQPRTRVVCACCRDEGERGGVGPGGGVLIVPCYDRWRRAGRPGTVPVPRRAAA